MSFLWYNLISQKLIFPIHCNATYILSTLYNVSHSRISTPERGGENFIRKLCYTRHWYKQQHTIHNTCMACSPFFHLTTIILSSASIPKLDTKKVSNLSIHTHTQTTLTEYTQNNLHKFSWNLPLHNMWGFSEERWVL